MCLRKIRCEVIRQRSVSEKHGSLWEKRGGISEKHGICWRRTVGHMSRERSIMSAFIHLENVIQNS